MILLECVNNERIWYWKESFHIHAYHLFLPLTLKYAELCQQYLERKAMHRVPFVVPLTMNCA
jgi:hypothetical protein